MSLQVQDQINSFVWEQLRVRKQTAAWASDEQHGTQIFSLILHFSISQHRNSYTGICSAYITEMHTELPFFFFLFFWRQISNPFTC